MFFLHILILYHLLEEVIFTLYYLYTTTTATKGDPDAMKMVLQHFSGYIARLSMRKLYDERGNVYFGIDNDIRERLQAKLMMAVLNFRTEK